MVDGTELTVWQFRDLNGFGPGRLSAGMVMREGEPVDITLYNDLDRDVDQANDGVPGTSGYVSGMGGSGSGHGGGNSGSMGMGFGRVSGYSSLGSPFTYRFIPPHAGTYMYHCHVDTVLHLEMGMYGTVIIRPPDGNDSHAWADGPVFDREYIWHLHTFDSTWHSQMVSGPRTVRHRPDYFMINGRDGASSVNDPTSMIVASPGERVLIRLINVGYQPALIELGGLSFDVIASDGRPLPAPLTVNEHLVAPGERYDIMFTLPAEANSSAMVEYLDIRLRKVLGHASTRIVAL